MTSTVVFSRPDHLQSCLDRIDQAIDLIRHSRTGRDVSLQLNALRLTTGTLIEALDEKPEMSRALADQADTILALTAQTLEQHEHVGVVAEVLGRIRDGRADLAEAAVH